MNGSEETILSTTRYMLAASGGAKGLIERTDVETGASFLSRFNLDALGREVGAMLDDADASKSGLPVALAGLALRFPAIPVDHVAASLAEVVPAGLRDVVSDGSLLFALKDDIDRFDGAAQHLYRLEVGTAHAGIAALDLATLELSGGRMITGLVLIGDWLYVMVADATAGFDIFRAHATSHSPTFEAMLERGAQRFALNAVVSAVAPYPSAPLGTLLLGTAALAGGDELVGNWGPELLRLEPDGNWDIVLGQPRFTPVGLKRPLYNSLPGIGGQSNVAVKAIATAEIGGQTTIYLALQNFLGEPCIDRRVTIPDLMDYMGTLRLFRSVDLVQWEEVPIDMLQDSGPVTALVITKKGVILGHESIGGEKLPVTFAPHSH